jgi:RNase H-like domain found in reverse transcriptase/Integrase zinc binding domain
LVWYIAIFLPKLAEQTKILTPLTTNNAKKNFPIWSSIHQTAFNNIKRLVTSAECLTVINHENPGTNQIYVTCDASDWCTGATLSFGKTWETACPIAFDSMQLKAAEKNYPVHEKELLAIIHVLKKWCSNLLGSQFTVYMDHQTLQNFNKQHDLSRRQLRWQEFLSQYDMTIIYLLGDDNTVTDALSHLPPNCFPDELTTWPDASGTTHVASVLSITSDNSLLRAIKNGYDSDTYCKCLANSSVPGTTTKDGLWYVGGHLLVPQVPNVCESLFRLAHDSLGHFRADKSYATLRTTYYWPNMHQDLEQSYIPSCSECQ